MWIDEARRDDQIRRVDGFRGAVRHFPDLGDLSILYCDVGAPSKGAGAVDNCSILDDEIVGHSTPSGMRFEAKRVDFRYRRKDCRGARITIKACVPHGTTPALISDI